MMCTAVVNSEEFIKDEEPFGLGCALESFSEVNEVLEMITNIKELEHKPKSHVERAYERYSFILGTYLEQPHLLDSHIDKLLDRFINTVKDPASSLATKHATFQYMYILIKVRGYKVVVRHLPHEVSDFEPVLQFLEAQDPADSDTWTTRYVLLLWLSIIVMIPFHMSRLDGFDSDKTYDCKETVMYRVLEICKTYATVPDKCRDAAAYLTSLFLIRYDIKELYLTPFLKWAFELTVEPESTIFTKYGILSSIAQILKHGKREDLLPHATNLLQWVIDSKFKSEPDTNIQKLVCKIVQRIGLTFLPARVTSWRYQRGNRSLAANLSAGDGGTNAIKPSVTAAQREEEEIEVPDEVEEVIDQLIQALGNGDGVVRWSAAKGVGRVAGRLPKHLADEILGSILELFNPREGDGSWHGGCLALAELGRRGLLLPHRLPEVVPVILKALIYDEPKGYSSVGSHIRDAACYVCWSFARAYETDILKPFVNEIASALLVVTCFDREINCRRAASAAFQENVGRQGTFPYGIEILTAADFFTVSVRNSAYLEISVFIAQYEEYTRPLINHLMNRKVDHWDIAIREIAAKALHNLTPLAPDYMINTVLPTLFGKTKGIDLNGRHGSILAIGEILYSLSKVFESSGKTVAAVGTEILEATKKLIFDFNEKLYFRGLGGELMKQACADFIEKCSLAHLPFHGLSVIGDWQKLLNECLSYDVVTVRMAAITGLSACVSEYYQGTDSLIVQQRSEMIKGYIAELSSSNQVSRMGHALALGAMPDFIVISHFNEIISSLISATAISPNTVKWAESRRDAIKALTSVSTNEKLYTTSVIQENHIIEVYETFFIGLTEYTKDNRGDIGAWVREASITGLQALTILVAKYKPEFLSTNMVTRIISGVTQQAVEKIDRTRALAGRIFYSFIHNNPPIPNIPQHQNLTEIFHPDHCDMLNWNSAAVTFPKFVHLIQFPEYTYNLMLGFVCSTGDLTETLVKNSSASLFEYLKVEEQKKGAAELVRLCDIIHQIFVDFQKNDRITVPMFRFLDKLFGSGCIKAVIDDPNSEFPKKILKLIQSEIAGCKNIYKLIDGIDVLCQFLQIKSDVCDTALVQLSILLCHPQTYVRRSTSNKLYESVLVYGDNSIIPAENLDEIMNLLSDTNWEDPAETVKPIRNNLCKLMGIRVPVTKKRI